MLILKSQQRLKIEVHNVYTEKINKIALTGNDDKRLQTFDKTTLYSYGINAQKMCKKELLERLNIKRLILIMLLMRRKLNVI